MKRQQGFTMIELMVSMLMFAVVGVGMVAFTSSTLQTLSAESRVSMASMELKNALGLLASELRMSSAISPYLPGNDPTATNCSTAVSVSSTAVKFLVSEDDSSATTTSGLQPYYVGYRYDAGTKQLLRGEVPSGSLVACSVPASDPTISPNAATIATRVVPIDADSDGTADPVFELAGQVLTIRLGVEVKTTMGTTATQTFVSKAYMRSHQ